MIVLLKHNHQFTPWNMEHLIFYFSFNPKWILFYFQNCALLGGVMLIMESFSWYIIYWYSIGSVHWTDKRM